MTDEYIRKQNAIRLAEQGQIQGFPWQFQMLVRLPSADVAPVKHGMWIPYRCDMYECSECAHIYTSSDIEKCDANFCPMCGAKMDGECREE